MKGAWSLAFLVIFVFSAMSTARAQHIAILDTGLQERTTNSLGNLVSVTNRALNAGRVVAQRCFSIEDRILGEGDTDFMF